VKTAPAASIRLGASRWYQCAVVLLTIILVAACAKFYWASGQVNTRNVVFLAAAATGAAWGVLDAFRARQGALHYAAGEWVLAQGELEIQGTLQVVIDLQDYLLVRFTPLQLAPVHGPLQKFKSPWLHLERRHTLRHGKLREAAPGDDWRALRRALYAPPSTHNASAMAADNV
jgi:hypothetical protein